MKLLSEKEFIKAIEEVLSLCKTMKGCIGKRNGLEKIERCYLDGCKLLQELSAIVRASNCHEDVVAEVGNSFRTLNMVYEAAKRNDSDEAETGCAWGRLNLSCFLSACKIYRRSGTYFPK